MVIIERTKDRQYQGHDRRQKDRQYHGHNKKNKRTDNTLIILERIEGQTIT
jgi:hypothetical protein